MILSKNNLDNVNANHVSKPDEVLFKLPVKVMQFGTGVLLRGLSDYLIDKANRQGVFNGRVVVVKSTNSGDTLSFKKQDNLYTLLVRGFEKGKKIEENIISAAISDILSANDEWDKVLAEAGNPELKVIVSNTTEVGIQLKEEYIHLSPPASFPAKLLAILYNRFQMFNGAPENGLVIIPTELLPNNGAILKNIVLKLSHYNRLGNEFEDWLNTYNFFCNSLVDRIVPGKPSEQEQANIQHDLGYQDELMTMAEVYHLWAIEGDEWVKGILSFEQVSDNVIITPSIESFRELKLRLLNGTHTLSCAVAILAGFNTVNAAMDDASFLKFIESIMAEISIALPENIDLQDAIRFSENVSDRFHNPFIKHLWVSIAQQFSAKLKMRVLPVLFRYYKEFNKAPHYIAIGFAAYLVFMRSKKVRQQYHGEYKGVTYIINDDHAEYLSRLWQRAGQTNIVRMVLGDINLWETDLTALSGFVDAVQKYVDAILAGDMMNLLTGIQTGFFNEQLS